MSRSSGRFLRQLQQFIAFSSVSSDPGHRQSVLDCAAWLQQHFAAMGMQQARLYSTVSHPAVYAEYLVDPGLPTVLFYGHYDVQLADPPDEWHTHPFRAVIQGDYLYGRGASDDKGQLFIHLKAVETLLRQTGTLPVNVKFLVEGAEETGSTGLRRLILQQQEQLRCDVVVVSDTKMISTTVPAITYSLRGALNATLTLRSGIKDLHSGTFGGAVPNAILLLSRLLDTFFAGDGSVAIPGFYDALLPVEAAERQFMRRNGFTDDVLLQQAGTALAAGEAAFTLYERTTLRPALSVTSISGGHQSKGTRNAIPAWAIAQLNFRLVPGQRPERTAWLLNRHLAKATPLGAVVKVSYHSPASPVSFARSNYFIKAAARAYAQVFGTPPHLVRSGGTIPAVGYLHHLLRVPVVLMGFAQVGDNMHAPNERFYLPNFFKGIDTSIAFLRNLPGMPVKPFYVWNR